PALSVLPLERRGWVSGAESLVTDLLATAGLINLGASITPEGSRFSLEWLVTLKPDRLLLAGRNPRADDQGLALLRHPALAAWMRPERTLILPDALTVCGGPMIADALDQLADEIARTDAAALSR
ncbi:MAG TPA: ABC transporter substrate-binding protein, partial [Beijerinckiaceae bacterium]|nr:ABC transporter substrate-binding protein [Beijerinckiaceae bacterium]